MEIIHLVNQILWGKGQLLIYLLLFGGIWFSVLLGWVQIRHFRHMIKLLFIKSARTNIHINSFQALCTGLSARVGTGNLAGVAVAISLGGSGAVFWMWLIAILGMATGYAESLLAQVYKFKNDQGEFRGGPAYYILYGLNQPKLAVLFSLCLFFGYGMSFSAIQANTISDAVFQAFHIPPIVTGSIVTLMAGFIIAGGLKSIAQFAARIVPAMGALFIVTTLLVFFSNLTLIPDMVVEIVQSAFGLGEAGAGALGAAIKNGVQRGLYSNEAGAGSVPHVAACATPTPNHPAAQGYTQMFGVFFDTIILCSCTAILLLLADLPMTGEMEGIGLTQSAMLVHFPAFGAYFVALVICLFGFTSVVANYAYAESNLGMLKMDHSLGKGVYTAFYLLMVFWGANASLKEAWTLADVALGLMTLVNMIAIIKLSPTLKEVHQDYHKQLSLNEQPTFRLKHQKIQGTIPPGTWIR